MDMDLEQKAIMRLCEAADTSERFYKASLIVTTSGGKTAPFAWRSQKRPVSTSRLCTITRP